MPGAAPMIGMMAAAAWWALVGAFELAATTVTAKIFLSQLSYVGALSVSVCLLLFALLYTRPERRLRIRTIAALWVVPVLGLLLAFTNDLHSLIWPRITLDLARNVAVYEHGPAFYALVVYNYGAVMVATGLLLAWAVSSPRPYRRQALAVVFGVPWPFVSNVLYVMGASPVPAVDLAPIGFTLAGLFISLGLRWLRLFDLVPVARESVLDEIGEGIVVLDATCRIVETNPTAVRLIGNVETLELGRPAGALLTGWIAAVPEAAEPSSLEHELKATGRHLEVRTKRLRDEGGRPRGWLVVIRDVTEGRAARAEIDRAHAALAQRVRDLEDALGQIRTLKGLIPICSHCKRIRNDSNYWEQLESFLAEHTDAEFSHGICPDCFDRESRRLDAAFGPDTETH